MVPGLILFFCKVLVFTVLFQSQNKYTTSSKSTICSYNKYSYRKDNVNGGSTFYTYTAYTTCPTGCCFKDIIACCIDSNSKIELNNDLDENDDNSNTAVSSSPIIGASVGVSVSVLVVIGFCGLFARCLRSKQSATERAVDEPGQTLEAANIGREGLDQTNRTLLAVMIDRGWRDLTNQTPSAVHIDRDVINQAEQTAPGADVGDVQSDGQQEFVYPVEVCPECPSRCPYQSVAGGISNAAFDSNTEADPESTSTQPPSYSELYGDRDAFSTQQRTG